MKLVLKLAFLLMLAALTLGAGCGGNKETVRFQPDPLDAPDPKPDMQPTDVKRPEPVRDIEPPKPTRAPLDLRTVYFDFDQSSLTLDATTTLSANARMLTDYPDVNIRVEGHCDERGTVEYNLALGQRRAISVRNYLLNYGINPSRITVISYGKERPVDPRSNAEAWRKNRRAEFIVLN
jgi:peptidoglycan-associated lipoprotein